MEFDQGQFKDLLTTILNEDLENKLVAILDKKLDAKFDPILKSLEFISNGFDELTQKISNLEQSNEILPGFQQPSKKIRMKLSNRLDRYWMSRLKSRIFQSVIERHYTSINQMLHHLVLVEVLVICRSLW